MAGFNAWTGYTDDDSQWWQFPGGDEEAPPAPPQYEVPSWAAGLPPEMLQYIRKFAGQSLQEPSEYGIASQSLQDLLGYQPNQFQFPMADIQRALEAQQGLQLEQYQKQIRPMLASQGQLDSSYYTNLIDNYLKGQQAQTYGNTADLLTRQAQQNYDLSKWLPQFKANVAGQLPGIGTQRANIQQLNLTTPFQTYIPAFGNVYNQGLELGDRQYGAANQQWLQAMKQYEGDQAQQAAMISSIGQVLGAGAGFALGGPGGAALGSSLGGGASTLFGGSGGGMDFGSALNFAYPQDQWAGLKEILAQQNNRGGGLNDLSSLFNQQTRYNPLTGAMNGGYF